jgi:transposase
MRQRTMILNAIRAHFAEFGIIAAQGPATVVELVARLRDGDLGAPELARSALLAAVRRSNVDILRTLSIRRWHGRT